MGINGVPVLSFCTFMAHIVGKKCDVWDEIKRVTELNQIHSMVIVSIQSIYSIYSMEVGELDYLMRLAQYRSSYASFRPHQAVTFSLRPHAPPLVAHFSFIAYKQLIAPGMIIAQTLLA
jgi:hypothetical protein